MIQRRIALAGAGLLGVLLLSGCGKSNGWDAIPVNGDSDNDSTCYQITEWKSNGFLDTGRLTWAKGVYCPAEITPQEGTSNE